MRKRSSRSEILLIDHPNTLYQLPAGTPKKDEELRLAALREAAEETGLDDLKLVSYLGKKSKSYTHRARLEKKSKLYSRPQTIASTFGKLRKGLKVKIIAEEGDFMQVKYQERDYTTKGRPVMVRLVGWIKKNNLTQVEHRHFYVLTTADQRTESWTIIADHHYLTLQWHPLDNLPDMKKSHYRWVEDYISVLKSSQLLPEGL